MSSIRADIELNAAPFIGGIAKVQRQIRNLQAAAAGITAAFLAARAAIAGLSGVFNEMKGALDLGGQLSDLSASTGASVSELVVLRQALANAGMGADAAGPMIARFQRALAGVNEDGVTTRGVPEGAKDDRPVPAVGWPERRPLPTIPTGRRAAADRPRGRWRDGADRDQPVRRGARACHAGGHAAGAPRSRPRDPRLHLGRRAGVPPRQVPAGAR